MSIMQISRKQTGLLVSVLLSGLLAPLALPAQTIFINDATIHTMSSQSVLEKADLLIRDGRIQSVGSNLAAPADATIIEAEGRPVTPGFFAGITAVGLQDIPAEASTVDHGLSTEAMRPEFDVSLAYNPDSVLVPITRIEGHTWTVLGASRQGSIIGGQGRAVLFDGGYQSFMGDKLLFIDVGADASGQSGGSRAGQWMLLNQAMTEAGSDEVRWTPDTLLTAAGRQALAGFVDRGVVLFEVDLSLIHI